MGYGSIGKWVYIFMTQCHLKNKHNKNKIIYPIFPRLFKDDNPVRG